LFPKPEQLAEANIARIGLPSTRAETIRTLARQAADNQITFDAKQDADDFRSRLLEIPGIGNWTGQYIAMRTLGDPDAFPANDLGLIRATSLRTARDITRRAEAWRRGAPAVMYLWAAMGSATPRLAAQRGNHRCLRDKPTVEKRHGERGLSTDSIRRADTRASQLGICQRIHEGGRGMVS
jgi:3-methyladenine DNA glycosylase/8-oxoguanine DNA glycosylase